MDARRRPDDKAAPHAASNEAARGETRFSPRRKSEIPATIYFDGTTVSVPCLIRDMSVTGARLQMREGWADKFTSEIKSAAKVILVIRNDRVMYDCKVVRRGDTELGLKFLSAPRPMAKGR